MHKYESYRKPSSVCQFISYVFFPYCNQLQTHSKNKQILKMIVIKTINEYLNMAQMTVTNLFYILCTCKNAIITKVTATTTKNYSNETKTRKKKSSNDEKKCQKQFQWLFANDASVNFNKLIIYLSNNLIFFYKNYRLFCFRALNQIEIRFTNHCIVSVVFTLYTVVVVAYYQYQMMMFLFFNYFSTAIS